MTALTQHPPVRIPPSLDARPKWKGRYPIPFVMFIDAEGRPDFRVNDQEKQLATIRRRLCALCGEKLPPNWSALIGGPACERSHLFGDGPMHEGCARYAFTICPYLAAPHAHHAHVEIINARHAGGDREISVDERSGSERPARMGLFFTQRFDVVRVEGSGDHLYFRVPAFERVEWYA